MLDSGFRQSRLLLCSTVALVLAILYTAGIFLQRSQLDAELDQARKAKQAEAARRSVQLNGGDRLQVLALSVSPGHVRPGQRTLLCYGVVNAKTVAIEHVSQALSPSRNRCLEIFPQHDTTYKLTAVGAAGDKVQAKVTVKVE